MVDKVYTPEALTQLAANSIGLSIKDESGATIGFVLHAWVEDMRVFARMQLRGDVITSIIAQSKR